MQNTLLKCMLVIGMIISVSFTHKKHPIFISVTEIDYNNKNKSVEISCKIFTDDFEKTLRNAYQTKIDLTDASLKTKMDKVMYDYMNKHLQLMVNTNAVQLKYIGYEQIEEAVHCYFEIENVATFTSLQITNTILYDYKKEQTNLMHVNYSGQIKSKKLLNPDKNWMVTY